MPIPQNEDQRNLGVEGLQLLDSPAEDRFDRITRLTCRALGVPISMVTLIHQDRQWFKSAQGHLINETPRVESFCQYTLVNDEPLVVKNPLEDSRFATLPAVTQMGVRFYAGTPIRDESKNNVGTLCVLDTESRELNAEELQVLKDLALCVESELRLKGLLSVEQELLNQLDALKRKVATDPVTRCWNPAETMEILQRVRKKHEYTGAIGMVGFEVGRVDEFNESYGRDAGDLLLRATANRLRAGLQTEMVLGRLPGPRFLALLLQIDPKDPEGFCREVVSNLHQSRVNHSKGPMPVEVYAGFCIEKSYQSNEELLARIEAGLEMARSKGRGHLVCN